MRLVATLTRNVADCEMLVRVMVFNVAIGNCDDHSKKFSFVWDRDCQWRLAPAYDLTVQDGPFGEHFAAVAGKGRDITVRDLAQVAGLGGVSSGRTREICGEVIEAVASSGFVPRISAVHG